MLDTLNKYKEITEAIVEHAKTEAPRECCGLVISFKGKPQYYPCKNIHPEYNNFLLDPSDYIAAETKGDVLAVVHSHVQHLAKFSSFDIASINKGNVPWILYSLQDNKFVEKYPEVTIESFLGREYMYGVQDCFTLVQDWYKAELNMDINYPKSRDPLDPTLGAGLYALFEEHGFVEIPLKELKYGDGVIMCNASSQPNHAGIYLGENVILHHPAGRLSCRTIFGGMWLKNTWKCVRPKVLV